MSFVLYLILLGGIPELPAPVYGSWGSSCATNTKHILFMLTKIFYILEEPAGNKVAPGK